MSLSDTAVSRFGSGFSCAQAVFSTLAERYGLDQELTCRLAAAFGGGMGRMGGTCGAVSGALMALGLEYGGPDKEAKAKTYEMVREFARRFQAANGSTVCNDLLGCDISTEEGHKYASENRIPEVCPGVVRSATEIAEQMLAER